MSRPERPSFLGGGEGVGSGGASRAMTTVDLDKAVRRVRDVDRVVPIVVGCRLLVALLGLPPREARLAE